MTRGRVLLAAPRSFCAGVDRAIEIVERLLEQHGPPVYVRHAIVHNEHVLRRLEGLGAVFVESEDEIPEGAICVLSAHGVAPAVKENAQARGLRVVDATCPLVNKVHAEARRYADSGHLVALVGHENHVEVIGTLGERPDSTVVIESPEQARELVTDKPVAVITQTTLSLDDVAPIVDALEDHLGDAAAAARRRHLLRDAEPPGRGEGDGRAGRDARPRDRLGDELERAAARRGRAGGGRAGDARSTARASSTRRSSTATRRSASPPARRRRRSSCGRPPPGSPRSATRCPRRSPSRRRTSTSGCRRRSRAHDEHRGPVFDRGGAPVAVGDGHHERRLARGRRSGVGSTASRTSTPTARSRSSACRSGRRASSRISSALLERVVPGEAARRASGSSRSCSARARSRCRSRDGALCLGQWQRILLFSLDAQHRPEWTLTLLG